MSRKSNNLKKRIRMLEARDGKKIAALEKEVKTLKSKLSSGDKQAVTLFWREDKSRHGRVFAFQANIDFDWLSRSVFRSQDRFIDGEQEIREISGRFEAALREIVQTKILNSGLVRSHNEGMVS